MNVTVRVRHVATACGLAVVLVAPAGVHCGWKVTAPFGG